MKVKRPIKLIRLRGKKNPAASTITRAAPLLLLHCLRTLCLCTHTYVNVYVCLKDTVKEGHRGGRHGTRAIEPFGDWDCYSAEDLPTTQQLIAAIICEIVADATSSSISPVSCPTLSAGHHQPIECALFSKK